MAEINQHNRTIGIVEGSTWGTAVQATSKLSVTQFSAPASNEIKQTANHDRAFNPGKLKAGRNTIDFSASGQASFGEGWLLLYTLFAGTSTGSPAEVNVGQGDYLHNIDFSVDAAKFFSCAWENETDTVHEVASVALTQFSFEIKENEAITWSSSGIGSNKVVTGAATSNAQLNALADVMTCPDEMAIMNTSNTYVRLADYSSSTALDSGDECLVESVSISIQRNKSRRYGIRGASTVDTLQPFQDQMFQGTVDIMLAEQDDSVIDLFTKYKNSTALMMEIFVDGTQIGTGANASLKFQLPYLIPQNDKGSDGVQAQAGFSKPSLTCRMGTIDTAPAGMSGVTDNPMRLVSVDERSTAYTS